MYDFVVAKSTFDRAMRDPRFKSLLTQTAVEAVAERYLEKIEVSRSVVLQGVKYKGQVKMAALPRDKSFSEPATKIPTTQQQKPQAKVQELARNDLQSEPRKPTYTIVHSGEIDMSEYTNARVSSIPSRPKSLVIRINLPTMVLYRF